jgi:hypothetical protein
LTSLEGCPYKVGEDFTCVNNRLTSLEGCITTVVGDFMCGRNQLTSLESFPITLGGNLYCNSNKLPSEIKDIFYKDDTLSREDQRIFLKYQAYYDIWTPEFNIDGFNDLIAEIRDGLR